MKNNILWLVAGLFGVVAATSLSLVFENHWVGYFASMTVAIVILVMMANSMMKTISSSGMKKTMIYLFGFLVIMQVYNSIKDLNKAQFQRETLNEIRLTIEESIGQMESERLLIQTLRSHYLNDRDSTLEAHFRKISGDRLQEDGSVDLGYMQEEDAQKLYYEIPASDSIVIYVNSVVAKGSDPEFQNRDGNTGRYEAIAFLTKRGVRYVRKN